MPRLIGTFRNSGEAISEVHCGPGHTLAFSLKSQVYSWGESFEGKLGLGYNGKTRSCNTYEHPKEIAKGFEQAQEGKSTKIEFKSAGCGQTINFAIMHNG